MELECETQAWYMLWSHNVVVVEDAATVHG